MLSEHQYRSSPIKFGKASRLQLHCRFSPQGSLSQHCTDLQETSVRFSWPMAKVSNIKLVLASSVSSTRQQWAHWQQQLELQCFSETRHQEEENDLNDNSNWKWGGIDSPGLHRLFWVPHPNTDQWNWSIFIGRRRLNIANIWQLLWRCRRKISLDEIWLELQFRIFSLFNGNNNN